MVIVSALILLIHPGFGVAGIDLPWSTTFDCDEWKTPDSFEIGCDGLQRGADSTCQGFMEQITKDANYPEGGGGRGQRHWEGDGVNCQSGGVRIVLNNFEPELWIRWYMKYEAGFKWSSLMYDKLLYIWTAANMSEESAVIGLRGSDGFKITAQKGDNKNHGCGKGCGWNTIHGGSVSDGSWHCYEVHMKAETDNNDNDGIAEGWIDGTKVYSVSNIDWGKVMTGWKWMFVGSNQRTPDNGRIMHVDFDDIAISNTGHIGLIDDGQDTSGSIFFKEDFEDSDFALRGWYDNTDIQLSSDEHVSGSTNSAEFHFIQGDTKPLSGSAIRKKFTDTDEVYISYFVKYSENWKGSNKPYHPHEFYLLTNADGDWTGPASTHLTAYIEQNEGVPLLSIQDAQNIDESNIGVDLTHITENRAVAGCNGDGDCYQVGEVHRNGKQWKAGSIYFQDNPGQYYKNDWHFIEAYFKLNTISVGKGVADGQARYWYDGNLIIDHNDVIMRTAQHTDMKFNQFLIGPYIGDGSPVDQNFWIDNLTVATSRGQGEILPGVPIVLASENDLQVAVNTTRQNTEILWLPQGIDLTKHSMGPFTVKVRVEGVDEQRYPSIIPRIIYYMGTGSSLGYFDMIKEGDNVWRFDIPDPKWHRYRSKSLRYQVKVFDEEGNAIIEGRWQKELIDSFVQDYK